MLLSVAASAVLAWGVGYSATIAVATHKLAALVLGITVLPLLVIHLEWGALLFLGVLWARVSDIAIKFHGSPSLAVPFGGLLIAASLVRKLSAGERLGVATFRDLYPTVPYVLVVSLSALWSVYPEMALASAAALIKDVFIFWVLADLLRSQSVLKNAAQVLVVTAGFLGAVNLHQHFTGNFTSNYGGLAQASLRNILGEFDSYRIGGPLDTPNVFPVILALTLPLGLALLRTRLDPIRRCLIAGSVPVIVLTVLMTYSRGAAILTALLLVLALRRYRIGAPQVLAAAFVVALVVLVAPANVWARLETVTLPLSGGGEIGRLVDYAVDLRLGAQRIAWEMFLSSPFLGVGAGNYPLLYQDYSHGLGVRALSQQVYWAHNAYLEVLAETGLIGLLAYLGLALGPLLALRRARSFDSATGPEADDRREISYGLEVAFLGYLVHGFFEGAAYPRYFWMLLALVVSAARLTPAVGLGGRQGPPARHAAAGEPVGRGEGTEPA